MGQVYRDHTARSGYVRLAEAMPEAEAVLVDQSPPVSWLLRGLAWASRRRSTTRWLTLAGLRMEAAAVRRMLMRPRPTVFHFLYGEAGFAWAARWARRCGHACIATFHVPSSLAPTVLCRPREIARLDGVVLVGSSQRSFFEQYVSDAGRLWVVPHGVDCGYFVPGPPRECRGFTCLSVGSFLRDYEVLGRVADAFVQMPEVRFIVVAPPQAVPGLAGRPNVAVLHGLSDAGLLRAYQTSDAFVLTAEDATANNALLEAMACGLPVVAEDVGSVRDYVDQTNASLCRPNDVSALVGAIRALVADRRRVRLMGDASRRRAEALSWSRVAERIREIYRCVLDSAGALRARPRTRGPQVRTALPDDAAEALPGGAFGP